MKPHALDTNSAFLFIKPTAVSSKVIKFVKKELKSAGLKVGREGTIDAHQISELEIIDNHYREISMLAMRTFPAEIQVTADAKAKFKAAFSEDWEVAIRAGRVLNVASALKTMDAKALALRYILLPEVVLSAGAGGMPTSGIGSNSHQGPTSRRSTRMAHTWSMAFMLQCGQSTSQQVTRFTG